MRAWTAIGTALLIVACASGGGDQGGGGSSEASLEDTAAKLEKKAARDPKDLDTQLELTEVYFKLARRELDAGNNVEYVSYLEKSQAAVLEATEIDPRSPSTHFWMGVIAAYQGDIDRTLVSMKNALRLDPRSPVWYTNVAETYIYMGKISNARRYLKKARRLGSPAVYIEINESMAAWRQGDYVEARDIFDSAYGLNPAVVAVWNEAPVSEPIQSFEDFTRFCCSHIACGPYMADACTEMKHEVAQRGVDAETARREIVLEMERRRRLEGIYKEHQELDIEVEKPEE